MKEKRSNNTRIINLAVGPLLFLLCTTLLPHQYFSTVAARGAIGTIAWMAYWWITGPVDFAVTGFLPVAVNAVIQMADMGLVIANYADEIILLLLGASIITASWELSGLDKRIASFFLVMIGNELRSQVVFWFLLTTVLSAVLPNAVVCAAITPIAVSMLRYLGMEDIGESRTGSMILMTIAYGAGVGGMASPLGGAMNLVTVQYLEEVTGKEYIYWHWVIRFLPIMAVVIISNLIYLVCRCKKGENLGGSREYFVRQYHSMGKMSGDEKWGLGLFLVATVLSFTRQLYQDYLPGLKPAYVFIICAIIAFVIVKRDGSRLITWKSAEVKIIWDLLYIYAGGLAAGTLINESGAGKAIGEHSHCGGCHADCHQHGAGDRPESGTVHLCSYHRCESVLHAADLDPCDPGGIRNEAAVHASSRCMADCYLHCIPVRYGVAAGNILAGIQHDLTEKIERNVPGHCRMLRFFVCCNRKCEDIVEWGMGRHG